MSKSAEAWMPIYIGDYLGDTQRLTTEQHGAYLLLIFDYWRNGPPPDDDQVLQQITKLDRAGWKRHKPVLARLFKLVDGEWHHKRIDAEREAAKENQERRSSKAKAAAEARWGDAPRNARSMPEAKLGECPPPSPASNEAISDASASSPVLKPEHVVEAWNDMACRHGLPKVAKLTPARRRTLNARIREHPISDFTEAISAIERSPFLLGENDRAWRADFDFILQPTSFTKLIEGSYDRSR